MTELQYNKAWDFIRSIDKNGSLNAVAMGYMVVLEERDGSHLLRSINVFPRHGERLTDTIKDLAGMAQNYGVRFKSE